MKKLPILIDNSAPPEEQQRQLKKLQELILLEHVERFENNDQDAWYDLMTYAVTHAPGIPEKTRAKLRRRLIQVLNGESPLDPISRERRAMEKLDGDIYSAMTRIGGSVTDAKKIVAEQFGVSAATVYRCYRRHIERWPECRRLDGRNKQQTKDKKKPTATYIKG